MIPSVFEFVELAIGEGERRTEQIDPETLRSRLSAAGVDTTIHLPYRQPLVTPVDRLDDATMSYMTDLLDVAATLDAERAVVHPRTRGVDPNGSSARNRFRSLTTAGRDRDVTVCFETVGYAGGHSLEQVGEIASSADAAVCLDVGYAYLEAGTSGIESFVSSYGDLVEHCHVHGVRRRNDTHIPLGSGDLPLHSVAELLVAETNTATAAIEVFTDDFEHLADSHRRFQEAIA
jgi:sugar phosphate isomerase/epimerase